ncbi:MAG: AAA family ATPase [Dethiobacter sp.]|jgi:CO dehydrogenase maturation factor|nr:AAA family ATPase [Dethiobacter sp.]
MKQVAIAGKGGVGKTTFAALLLRYLQKNRPDILLLAVDADPNANLNEALGLKVDKTISTILEGTKDPKAVPSGMTKEMYMEYKLLDAVVEAEKIDLLVMGNPQKSGCYCYPNDLLRKNLEKLRSNYDYVIIDNEAGLEHLSRRIVSQVDLLIVVSDSTVRGVRSAARVYEIVQAVSLDVKAVYLVVSKTTDTEVAKLQEEIAKTGLELLGSIPLDPLVAEYDLQGRPVVDLPDDAVAVVAFSKIADKLKL